MDETEDFKVCVTESLLILKRNGYTAATIGFTVGESLGCEICGTSPDGGKEESMEDEISRALLSALLGKVDFTKDQEGRVQKIAFEG